MAKRKDPLLEALQNGRAFTWTVPDGGDLASMRAAIKHGQTLTMSPVVDARQVQVGDLVLVKWYKGYIIHLVQEIQGDQFLIANSLGKVNGWVAGNDILGRVTQIVEPEPLYMNIDKTLQATYDHIAPAITARYVEVPANLADLMALLSLYVGADGVIADVGCGSGRDVAWLERLGHKVVGLF